MDLVDVDVGEGLVARQIAKDRELPEDALPACLQRQVEVLRIGHFAGLVPELDRRSRKPCPDRTESPIQLLVRDIVQGTGRYAFSEVGQIVEATEDQVKPSTSGLDRITVIRIAVEDPEAASQHSRGILPQAVGESKSRRNVVGIPVPEVFPRAISIREQHPPDRVLRDAVLAR